MKILKYDSRIKIRNVTQDNARDSRPYALAVRQPAIRLFDLLEPADFQNILIFVFILGVNEA